MNTTDNYKVLLDALKSCPNVLSELISAGVEQQAVAESYLTNNEAMK